MGVPGGAGEGPSHGAGMTSPQWLMPRPESLPVQYWVLDSPGPASDWALTCRRAARDRPSGLDGGREMSAMAFHHLPIHLGADQFATGPIPSRGALLEAHNHQATADLRPINVERGSKAEGFQAGNYTGTCTVKRQ
jgi:hypothetical protein